MVFKTNSFPFGVDEAIAIIDKFLEIGDKEAESTDVPLSKSSEYK